MKLSWWYGNYGGYDYCDILMCDLLILFLKICSLVIKI